jgi:hypothetical protein
VLIRKITGIILVNLLLASVLSSLLEGINRLEESITDKDPNHHENWHEQDSCY